MEHKIMELLESIDTVIVSPFSDDKEIIKTINNLTDGIRKEINSNNDIQFKNIDLTGISEFEQTQKVTEEQREFAEAYFIYSQNKTEENKTHLIEELFDEFQSKLGLLDKEGIKAEEVQAYYSTWVKKLDNRPRKKECKKCINCSLTSYGGKKVHQCDKNDEMIYSEDYAKGCKSYKEAEKSNVGE